MTNINRIEFVHHPAIDQNEVKTAGRDLWQ